MAAYLQNHDLQAVFFLLGMFFVGMTIVTEGLMVRPGGAEIAIAVGIVAVYFMAFTRITLLEERSHLIEYSMVAVFAVITILVLSWARKRIRKRKEVK